MFTWKRPSWNLTEARLNLATHPVLECLHSWKFSCKRKRLFNMRHVGTKDGTWTKEIEFLSNVNQIFWKGLAFLFLLSATAFISFDLITSRVETSCKRKAKYAMRSKLSPSWVQHGLKFLYSYLCSTASSLIIRISYPFAPYIPETTPIQEITDHGIFSSCFAMIQICSTEKKGLFLTERA